MTEKEPCEGCGQLRVSTLWRPNGQRLCTDCNCYRMIAMAPVGWTYRALARRPRPRDTGVIDIDIIAFLIVILLVIVAIVAFYAAVGAPPLR